MINDFKQYSLFVFLFSSFCSFAQQLVEISGKVTAVDDVESVHILNKRSNKFTVTDEKGEFLIQVKLNDTLVVSSIKYYAKRVLIDEKILVDKLVTIELEELVNQLDEVIVGRVLTGDLQSDLDIKDVKRDINFYDVGIPGNTNLPITQKERRLQEADHGKFVYYYGIGFAINVNKILNRISGRTRKLKELVALEDRDQCMDKTMYAFSDILFPEEKYKKEEIFAFFFYAAEDERFKNKCAINNDMEMFSYLQEKQKTFLENLELLQED